MKNKKIYQVDAFTCEAFKGNPAGVMVLDEAMDDQLMQHIATEMNVSETAFILPQEGWFNIRYFTPAYEVPLCGHATLASAHILYELGIKKPDETIYFKAKGADLNITKKEGRIVMRFPTYPLNKINTPEKFKELVGFEPVEVYSSSYNWIVAVAPHETDIIQAKPNFELLNPYGIGHLMITSQCSSPGFDYVLRCFAPIAGINEDPVTGSAQCALAPLWSGKLGKKRMNAIQLSKRGGSLGVEFQEEQVEISGQAVTTFEIKLKI